MGGLIVEFEDWKKGFAEDDFSTSSRRIFGPGDELRRKVGFPQRLE